MVFNIRKPQHEDTKEVTRFAILPVRIDINTVVWLKKYKIKYQFRSKYCEEHWAEVKRWIGKDEVEK